MVHLPMHNTLPTHLLDERTSEVTHEHMMRKGIDYISERTKTYIATPRWRVVTRYRMKSELLGQTELLRTLNRWSMHEAIYGEGDAHI